MKATVALAAAVALLFLMGCGTKTVTVIKTVSPSPSPAQSPSQAFVGTWQDTADNMYLDIKNSSDAGWFNGRWINSDGSMQSVTFVLGSSQNKLSGPGNLIRLTLVSPNLLQAHYLAAGNTWTDAVFTRQPGSAPSPTTSPA
jgi:uncharacterized lipoprotein NlpE involved in copper resistance